MRREEMGGCANIKFPLTPRLWMAFVGLLVCAPPVELKAQFAFATNNGALTITNYTGSGGTVVIPASTNGYPVTAFSFPSFANQTTITNVIIPGSITNMGWSAFYECTGLKSVTIDDGVTNIGEGAFYYCTQLASVAIPNSVTSISNFAFGYCYDLTNVTIPDSVTNIDDLAFYYCDGLRNLVIPNSVTSIGAEAFYTCYGLTNVTFSDSLISIGSSAFSGCTGLKNVTIPNSVTDIESNAFEFCEQLTNMTIPASVTNLGRLAFFSCPKLTNVYFQGNAPSVDGTPGSTDTSVFTNETGTVYYVPGTTGWGSTFGGWPTAPLYQMQLQTLASGQGFGEPKTPFKFSISWGTNASAVVLASTNLLN